MAYVPRLSSVGLTTLPWYNGGLNPFTPLRIHANCTTYAYGRWLEITNGDTTKFSGLFGSPVGSRWGGAWYAASPTLRAGKRNPQKGDIMCWRYGNRNPYDGHVAVVEQVFSDYVVASASYYGSNKLFNTEDMPVITDYRSPWLVNYGAVFQGFIRMGGPSGGVVPSIVMPTSWVARPDYHDMTQQDKDNNAVMAYVQLSSYGWTLEAICGAIGNFCRESNLDPQAQGTGGCGLVGWTPPENLRRWTQYHGYTWYDGNRQIEFIDMGVYCSGYYSDGTPILEAQWLPGRVGGLSYSDYKQMTDTPEAMAKYFMDGYEAPGVPALDERQYWARYYYDYLQGINLVDLIRPDTLKRPLWYGMGSHYEVKIF